MNGQIPRMNGGEFPTAAILAFMGMTGGAYYLYKQKGAKHPPRVPDSNPDSITNKELPGPGEADTKMQDFKEWQRWNQP